MPLPALSEVNVWTKWLELDGFEVVHLEEDRQSLHVRLTVVPAQAVAMCPHCGKLSQDIRQKRSEAGVRDLPYGRYTVELEVRRFQYECANCGHAFTPPCPGLAEGSHATERFLERAAVLIRGSDIAHAAAFFAVPEKTLERWYYAYVERQQTRPRNEAQPIRCLGIDELSLKKSTDSSSRS